MSIWLGNDINRQNANSYQSRIVDSELIKFLFFNGSSLNLYVTGPFRSDVGCICTPGLEIYKVDIYLMYLNENK